MLFLCECKVAYRSQRGRVLYAKHPLSRLYHLHEQLFGFLPSPLIPKRRRQVGYAGQRVWVFLAWQPLTSLYHLHL
jgi:hypothetical protein